MSEDPSGAMATRGSGTLAAIEGRRGVRLWGPVVMLVARPVLAVAA